MRFLLVLISMFLLSGLSQAKSVDEDPGKLIKIKGHISLYLHPGKINKWFAHASGEVKKNKIFKKYYLSLIHI